jgi:plasmid stability protein
MTSITIHNLDDDLKARLYLRATRHGLSVEEEVRRILRQTLNEPLQAKGLGSKIHRRFSALGGADLELPVRSDAPRAADMEP